MPNSKAEAIVKLAESKLGDPYVFGARGEKCTPSIRKTYASYHPEYKQKIFDACRALRYNATCSGCKWDGHLCYDCRGFTYFLLKSCGVIALEGGGATTQYSTAANWDARGKTADGIPDLVCCLFKQKEGKMSHTGMHVGGGRIIHCSTTVKEDKTTNKTWTHYAIPKGLYSKDELLKAGVVNLKATIRRGNIGDDVRTLQFDLYNLGYTNLMVDGAFGAKTETAVRDFQSKYGLTIDGIVGPKTWGMIEQKLTEIGRKDLVQNNQNDQNDEDLTAENKPIDITYPAGQLISIKAAAAADICQKISAGIAERKPWVEIVMPLDATASVPAVAAMNIYQQIKEKWK